MKFSVLFDTDLSWQSTLSFFLSFYLSLTHTHSFLLFLSPDRDVVVPLGIVWMVKRGGILSVHVNVEF